MTRGLYRRRKKGKGGKFRDAGSYVIDIRIKRVPELAGLKPRLVRTTEVPRDSRRAAEIVAEMKLMLKELQQQRDKKTLLRIQEGKLTLASAYKAWKQGRIQFAQAGEERRVVRDWLGYLDESGLAAKTKENRRYVVKGLMAKGFLTDQTTVNELPEIMQAVEKHYARTKQAMAFNQIRMEIRSFLIKGLGMDRESPFVHDVLRSRPMKPSDHRAEHPFNNPRECAAFCRKVMARPSPNGRIYAEAVMFMCLHGLRPEEFAGKRFRVDPETEHLRIDGTKNRRAKRVAPLCTALPDWDPPRIDTMNVAFTRMKSPVRCRDFRRTFSIWCLAAGIPENRIAAYMGHGFRTMTQRYQRTTPTQALLDEDRKRLRLWYEKELAAVPTPRSGEKPLSPFRQLVKAVSPSLAQLRAAAALEPHGPEPSPRAKKGSARRADS